MPQIHKDGGTGVNEAICMSKSYSAEEEFISSLSPLPPPPPYQSVFMVALAWDSTSSEEQLIYMILWSFPYDL